MAPDARRLRFPCTEPPQVVGVAGREEEIEKGEVKGAQSKIEVPFAFKTYQSHGRGDLFSRKNREIYK